MAGWRSKPSQSCGDQHAKISDCHFFCEFFLHFERSMSPSICQSYCRAFFGKWSCCVLFPNRKAKPDHYFMIIASNRKARLKMVKLFFCHVLLLFSGCLAVLMRCLSPLRIDAGWAESHFFLSSSILMALPIFRTDRRIRLWSCSSGCMNSTVFRLIA